ncbi:unnamed protein product [Blepharisma stoltei]|uniref:Transketolase-like pyrimidine-binding domain-containing protein n=1 Tax=Blepharisma stoltei TaxID=1481888 RepID=A0AAU9I915_9CILI|nr:unnamed protein product [Blepharisma stoltei]
MWRFLSRKFSEDSKINPLKYQRPGKDLYNGPVKAEFDHVFTQAEKDWLNTNYESFMTTPLNPSQKINIFRQLQMCNSFEEFMQKKFSSYKRFSGEGMESFIPLTFSIIEAQYNLHPQSSAILSFHHRGKLALLTSFMNYPLRNVFWNIQGNSLMPPELNDSCYYFTDDVSQMISTTFERKEFKGMKISMIHRPAHLEIGGTLAIGKTRSKIDSGKEALHLWYHGDAAVSGQGIIYEAAQMANLPDFSINGTMHMILNNQIGFTTGEENLRSTKHCTDVYKVIGAPIVHVNVLSPEEACKMGKLGILYRNKFKKDFVVDLIGYRKYGHNELDNPSFTNPLMYKSIKNIKQAAALYAEELINEGTFTEAVYNKIRKQLDDHLQKEYEESLQGNVIKYENNWVIDSFRGSWQNMTPLHNKTHIESGYDTQKLKEIAELSVKVPEDFKIHPIIAKGHISGRLENLAKNKVDWATAEAMAIGSLLQEGFNVRICGEDTIRGTFSQRHAGFYCQETEKLHIPFQDIKPGKFRAVSSLLSEFAVLGFEVGYSMDDPNNLVLWEAQFGDFANMAQPMIDLFIAGGEARWIRQNGIVVLLPNGQEGMGPDHSSARIGRALELVNNTQSTQFNMRVVNSVIPANYFHLLREQVHRKFRIPCILGTPKSGLRNKFAISEIDSLAPGTKFQPFFFNDLNGGSEKLFICNGKIYLDLLQQFQNDKISILLIEELSPFPFDQLNNELKRRGFPKQAIWVQEEPENVGLFRYIEPQLRKLFIGPIELVSRPGMSCSSDGNSVDFKLHQEAIYSAVKERLL